MVVFRYLKNFKRGVMIEKKENNANDIVDVVCIIFFFPIITPPLMCFFILSEPTISGCNLHYSLFSYNNSSLNVFFPIGTYNMWMLFTSFFFHIITSTVMFFSTTPISGGFILRTILHSEQSCVYEISIYGGV